jgi:DUF4097 and DUF4098 domain-containing protein YvlB
MRASGMAKLALCGALAALPASADSVDERLAAAADGTVVIESAGGQVRVEGWDRNEVSVTGELGSGADRVTLRGQPRKTRVEVEPSLHHHLGHADLLVRVPAGSQVNVESFQARVEVNGVKGGVRVETVNGSVSITGAAQQVSAETVNGGVTVRGRSARIHAESVNGPVSVSDPGPEVQAGNVNGPLTITGSRGLLRAKLENVNGAIHFEGELAPRGALDAETVGGRVELTLDTPAADFQISTFNGRIVNELGPAAPRRAPDADGDIGQELVFSIGGGGAQVTVRTLNGRIVLRAPQGQPRRQQKD